MRSLKQTILWRYVAVVVAAVLTGACADVARAPSPAPPVSDEVNFEGLQTVRVRRFEIGQVRPGTDFKRYAGVLFDSPELAYRTPDRSRQEVALEDEQKENFRVFVDEVFTAELGKMQHPALVDSPGEGVIRLEVRLQDITATVPPRSIGMVGRAAIALAAVGQVTLVIELYDSVSDEILARVVDTKAIEGAALAKDGAMITRWEDVDRIVARWASITRSGLESMVQH